MPLLGKDRAETRAEFQFHVSDKTSFVSPGGNVPKVRRGHPQGQKRQPLVLRLWLSEQT